ncbi:MAG: hypothetical protein H7Y42_04740 [Chitinophagaceae bacterium]|nr:hypothetical protein [Chitinophagaceae bacterium]
MKSILVLFLALPVLFAGCSKYTDNFLLDKNSNSGIAIQPLGNFDENDLIFIREEVARFYDKPVVILSSIELPATFLVRSEFPGYYADSILALLSQQNKGKYAEVIGITHVDIYASADSHSSRKKRPTSDRGALRGIFGIGYNPGRVCVVSDHRIRIEDSVIARQRLRTVILHEVGHNIGLQHCKVGTCLMSESNGFMPALDLCSGEYCGACKGKLSN